ncbi:MauE/DoxX family redox-associated membrane protein [Pedobacter sp. KLB.chiD]|uniref:MauE/DoxX family redox-associated membrane protein n=1 Tax=Pedobacter sp. KLB.chiD TaxID=3387402 RepID=UPI003999F578
MSHKTIITEITVLLLVVLFLYTGLSKFIDFKGFTRDLNNQPFPNSFTPFLRWAVPLTEIAIVGALIYDKTRLIGLYASLVLMSLFTIYTALVLLHVFAYVPCSCGGVIKHLSWPQHLLFNLFFVLITSIAIKQQNSKKQQMSIEIQ